MTIRPAPSVSYSMTVRLEVPVGSVRAASSKGRGRACAVGAKLHASGAIDQLFERFGSEAEFDRMMDLRVTTRDFLHNLDKAREALRRGKFAGLPQTDDRALSGPL
ncbi:hypothetical protein [Streptomyces iakyrus]|uniref:hypothetical protein n=1 Tax=Streptomyces iakyrus TaxID=68219 RepID=UPI0033CF6A67